MLRLKDALTIITPVYIGLHILDQAQLPGEYHLMFYLVFAKLTHSKQFIAPEQCISV